MPVVDRDHDHIIIPAGMFDGNPGVEPAVNIYVGSKADWFLIKDGLPKFEEDAPDEFWEPFLNSFRKKLSKLP